MQRAVRIGRQVDLVRPPLLLLGVEEALVRRNADRGVGAERRRARDVEQALTRRAVFVAIGVVGVGLIAGQVLQVGPAQVPVQVELQTVVIGEFALHRLVHVDLVRIGDRRVDLVVAEGRVVVERAVLDAGRRDRVVGRDHALVDVADAVAVVPVELGVAQAGGDVIAQVGLDLAFDDVALHGAGVAAGTDVLDEAFVAAFDRTADQEAQALGDRAADQGVGAPCAIVADRAADLALELVAGPLADDVQRAADRVTAIEGALRAAQDFRPFDEQRGRRGVGHRVREDAVGIERDRRVGADGVGQAAEAADRETVVVGVGDAGRHARQVLDRGHAHDVALLGRIGGHGDRDVLQALLALFSGDDQFLDGEGVLGRSLSRGGHGRDGRAHNEETA